MLLRTVCLSVCLFVRAFFRIAIFVIFIARKRGLGPGNGFAPVCIEGGELAPPQPELEKRVVRILLECSLVSKINGNSRYSFQ